MTGRLSVLVVAGARDGWSTAVARWSAGAALPVEIVRCVSPNEVRARLEGGRAWSAVLADASLPGIDRGLVAVASRAGCPVLLVTDGSRPPGTAAALGAVAEVGAPFSRDELLEALTAHARPLATGDAPVHPGPRTDGATRHGDLVAVIGPGGSGTTVAAAALAQGLAGPATAARRGRPAPRPRDVLLADLCRTADQAVLHDARDLVPGLREVVDAHRVRRPDATELRDQAAYVEDRGYHLLVGLRRASHWTALSPTAVDDTLEGLRRAFEVVVADCDPDLEGEDTTGAEEVEDRHHLSRATVRQASVVVVTFDPSALGCAKAIRTLTDVLALDVEPRRILLACSRAPRSPRARAEVAGALADLLRAGVGPVVDHLAAPLALPGRPVDAAVRDGRPLPDPLPDKLARAVTVLLDRAGGAPPDVVAPGGGSEAAAGATPEPVRIRPGELGLAGLDDEDGLDGGGPGAPDGDGPRRGT